MPRLIASRLRVITEQDWVAIAQNSVQQASGCVEWQGVMRSSQPEYFGHYIVPLIWAREGREKATHRISRTCKNIKCLNPAHMIDADAGAYHIVTPDTKGELNSNAILTEEDVLEIWDSPCSNVELAAEYGTHRSTISKIKNGINWRWHLIANGRIS